MVDIAALAAQLTIDEGVRLTPYIDTTGHTTIGIGRNLTAKGISRSEAEILLRNDIAAAIHDLDTALPWWKSLDAIRQGVMANMVFNMGIATFLTFTHTLTAIHFGDYTAAAAHMLDSTWAAQVGTRATRLAAQMKTGH